MCIRAPAKYQMRIVNQQTHKHLYAGDVFDWLMLLSRCSNTPAHCTFCQMPDARVPVHPIATPLAETKPSHKNDVDDCCSYINTIIITKPCGNGPGPCNIFCK